MSRKKAVRRQRAERAREKQSRRRSGPLVLAVLVFAGALLVFVTALIFGTGGADPDDNLVWSPEHGHWHRR